MYTFYLQAFRCFRCFCCRAVHLFIDLHCFVLFAFSPFAVSSGVEGGRAFALCPGETTCPPLLRHWLAYRVCGVKKPADRYHSNKKPVLEVINPLQVRLNEAFIPTFAIRPVRLWGIYIQPIYIIVYHYSSIHSDDSSILWPKKIIP